MQTTSFVKSAGMAMLTLFLMTNFTYTAKAGEHPNYLRALSDLRAARWMLNHRPGNWRQTNDEMEAISRIDKAIDEIKRAAIDDGKDVNWHPKIDERPDRPGRLHAAEDYLRKAREDVNREEDNNFAKGLKHRAMDHIDAAIAATDRAISAKY